MLYVTNRTLLQYRPNLIEPPPRKLDEIMRPINVSKLQLATNITLKGQQQLYDTKKQKKSGQEQDTDEEEDAFD